MALLRQNILEKIRDYAVDNQTLKRVVKQNPKDLIDIEVGDIHQPDFKPQFKLKRWDNEVNFSIRAEEHPLADVDVTGNTIKYITPEYEVHMYEKSEVSEDGGFEFEWILPKKPKSNVLTTTIQTKELDFFYQPELTQEEIDQGAFRPENVVGSYAVYHKTKGGMNRADGMEYKTGKAFHIYRPKATDANGNETWCELRIFEKLGMMNVVVPQAFLDNAVYPVIVDPTFGYTSIGASSDYNYIESPNGSKFAGAAGTVTDIRIGGVSDFGTINIKGLLVQHSDHEIVSNGISNAGTLVTGSSQFRTVTFSTNPTTSAIDYDLVFIAQDGSSYSRTNYDTGDANQGLNGYGSFYYNDITSPIPSATHSGYNSSYKYSIYATYTASGGTESTTTTAISSTLTPVVPSVSYKSVQSAGVSPVSITTGVVVPTAEEPGAGLAVEMRSPGSAFNIKLSATTSESTTTTAISATLTPVVPSVTYQSVKSTTTTALLTTLSAIVPSVSSGSTEETTATAVSITSTPVTPVVDFASVRTTTTTAVQQIFSVVTPVVAYQQVTNTGASPVSATLTVIVPVVDYQQISATTVNTLTATLSVVAPDTSFMAGRVTSPTAVSLTFSALAPTVAYVQVEATSPNSITLSLLPVEGSSGYLSEITTITTPVELTLTVPAPISEYEQVVVAGVSPIPQTLSVVVPSVNFSTPVYSTQPAPVLLTFTGVVPSNVMHNGTATQKRLVFVDGKLAIRLFSNYYTKV